MRGTLTHLGTVEHYRETGTEIDDGAGGTIAEKDWVTVVDATPCRYEPEGQGYVREDQGGRIYEQPRVYFPAHAVGRMATGDYSGEYGISYGGTEPFYYLDFEAGDDWRLTLDAIDGRFALSNPDVHFKGPQRPSHVVVEVERIDTSEGR